MNPEKPPPPEDANEEIAALIETLHQTGQRLEDLTAGEVDTVANREGRTFVLRRAQEQLRLSEVTKQAAILNALRDSEAELKAAQRVARIGNWYLDLGTSAIRWSEEIYRVFDRDPELPPPTYAELGQLLTVASAERMNAAIENSKQTGAPYETDLELLRADDPTKWIAAHGEVVRDDNGQIVGLRGTAQDITERKAQELKIVRLSRIQAVLSGINSLIVRVRDRNELFKEACRIAVEVGTFRMAWIGVIDPQTLDGKVVAWHGGEEGDLDKIRLTARDGTPDSEWPACRALRQMQPVICNDIATEPSLAALSDDLRRRGHKSAACFPLTVAGRAEAVIALFADELDFFDDEETRLLLELAGDISFALDHIDKQERLRAAEEQFRGLVEQSIAGIYIIQDDKLAYVNPRFAEIRGFGSAEELIGRDPMPLIAEKDRGIVAENRRRQFSGEVHSMSYNFTALCKDGSTVEVGVSSTCATYRGRSAIIGMMQDISEKKRAEDEIKGYVAQLESAFMSTVEVATTLGEMRDPYTAGHQRRVAEIAVTIGAELGFDTRRQEGLRVAGLLHDVGKINVPAEILTKPGKLSPIQFQLIQGHAQAGYDVLKNVGFPWPVAQVALQHHERMDGSGYPQGLKGEAILLEAKILAVADVVEAMSSHRPYRQGRGIEAALSEIEHGRGSLYDPAVADACLKLFREKGYAIPGSSSSDHARG